MLVFLVTRCIKPDTALVCTINLLLGQSSFKYVALAIFEEVKNDIDVICRQLAARVSNSSLKGEQNNIKN
jgi:hypothetical protein